MNKRWINHHFKFAAVAAEQSKCERDQVGAAAFRDKRIIATGYNGVCAGALDDMCELDNGKTRPEVAHAEINLIGQLARSTETSQGLSVFITRQPCMPCAVALLAAGIYDIHCYKRGSGEGVPHLQKHAKVTVYNPFTLETTNVTKG